MGYVPAPKPTFGHPIPRGGKPYIWVTWLAKQMGEEQCRWSAWFKAHHQYAKFETPESLAFLQEWNREHSALMRRVRTELEDAGWRCTVEDQNDFKIPGKVATVAGKADIVATFDPGGEALIVDGKTGRRKDSDWWQVFIYMLAYAIEAVRPPRLTGRDLRGEVRYTNGPRLQLRAAHVLAPEKGHVEDLTAMINLIAADTPPPRSPSRRECGRCNIGYADCPDRVREDAQAPAMPAAAVDTPF